MQVDHTRVKLKDVEETIPGAEYINANYIKHLMEYNDISEETNSISNEKRPWESTVQVNIFSFYFSHTLGLKLFFNSRIQSLQTRTAIIILKHI